MVSRWQKLNYLIPEPQCNMKGIGGILHIVNWKDERTQPTDSEIDGVTDEQVEAQELDDEAVGQLSSNKVNQVLLEIILGLENRVRTLEGGKGMTQTEFVAYLKDLYKEV